MLSLTALIVTSDPDCSKYSPERFSQECVERGNFAGGLFTIIAAVLLLAGWLWWRHKMKSVTQDSTCPGEPG